MNRHVVAFLVAPLAVPLVMSTVALQILCEVPFLYWFGLLVATGVAYARAILVVQHHARRRMPQANCVALAIQERLLEWQVCSADPRTDSVDMADKPGGICFAAVVFDKVTLHAAGRS